MVHLAFRGPSGVEVGGGGILPTGGEGGGCGIPCRMVDPAGYPG